MIKRSLLRVSTQEPDEPLGISQIPERVVPRPFRNFSSRKICSQMNVFNCALMAQVFSTASRAGSEVLRRAGGSG